MRGYREGTVRNRSQLKTLAGWTKRDDETGQFMDVKSETSYLAARAAPVGEPVNRADG
jgi:hypothetical protein